MKYALVIGAGAVVVGLLLSFVVDLLLGDWAGAFFVNFLAVPIGLVTSLGFFLVYDHYWPRERNRDIQEKNDQSDDP